MSEAYELPVEPTLPVEVPDLDDGDGPQMLTFFAERDEVLAIIVAIRDTISSEYNSEVPPMGINPDGVAIKFFMIETILSRYQESPTLLIPHLEELMQPFIDMLLPRMPKSFTKELTAVIDSEIAPDQYALGVDYDEYDSDSTKTVLHHICRALYFVVKVVGYKASTTFFPHDVKLLEDVFYCLRRWQVSKELHKEWEVRYCMLLWMSSLILVPFSLQVIDSSLSNKASLSQQLMTSAWSFMTDPSKCRDVAALLIARLNTRSDAQEHREAFFTKTIETISSGDGVALYGILQAVATTFKLGKREELMKYAPPLIPPIGKIALESRDVKIAKTAVKVLQRLGLSLLKQVTASWKYQIKVQSVEKNLGVIRTTTGTTTTTEGTAQEDIEVPDIVQDVISDLLGSLGHCDTIVRWSAAKGIGRICGRLPKEMSNDVVLAVIEVFDEWENTNGWHGGCLALAELCRRSILLPEMLERALPLVAKGLLYDISRGTYSVGTHVRDAACYVCWSVARAYNPSDLIKFAPQLSTALVTASLFDREVNVRRAAAAALQECVGRLGNFPDGISLVTAMDFFSLATTRNAYFNVAPEIARFDAYRTAIINNIVNKKLNHWDRNIRELASQSLAKVAYIAPQELIEQLLALISRAQDATDVVSRHGAILAVAELLISLPPTFLSQSIVNSAANIIPDLESRRLFRGRGVEYLRQASCRLVHNFAVADLHLPNNVNVTKVNNQKGKVVTKWQLQKFLEDCWKQPLEWLQQNAIDAFLVFSKRYYTTYEEFHEKVFQTMLDGVANTKPPNEQRGNIMALGAIPHALATATYKYHMNSTTALPAVKLWEVAVEALASKTVLDVNKDLHDAESRRNVIIAFGNLCTTLGASLTAAGLERICKVLIEQSLVDYAVDKRGDVGSFARIEALRTMPRILLIAIEHGIINTNSNNDNPSENPAKYVLLYIQAAIKQAVEKIDRMRHIAGTALMEFATVKENDKVIMRDCVLRVLSNLVSENDIAGLKMVLLANVINWAAPQETFPLLVSALLPTAAFGPAVMEGIPIAVGGLSVHVLKSAQAALCAAFEKDAEGLLTRQIIAVAAKYFHNDRVIIPVCITIERLLSESLFHSAYLGDVVEILQVETKFYAQDINKVLSFIPLLGELCHCNDTEVRTKAWHIALVLIASRYPKVRSRMGSELYTSLLMMNSCVDRTQLKVKVLLDDAMQKLTQTQWDNIDPTIVRSARDDMYPLLGLTKPSVQVAGTALTMNEVNSKCCSGIKMGTYKSLVHEMGY